MPNKRGNSEGSRGKRRGEDRLAALFVLALTTGMREGELLGLRWQDIDFERASVQVRLNVQQKDGRFALAELKTAYSRRNIGLSRTACSEKAILWYPETDSRAVFVSVLRTGVNDSAQYTARSKGRTRRRRRTSCGSARRSPPPQ
jgi:integrase